MYSRWLLCISFMLGTLFTGFSAFAAPSSKETLIAPIDSGWDILGGESPADLSGHWAERLFQWGIQNQIIDGYSDGSYKPDQPVTEAEFLLMFYRADGADPFLPTGEEWVKAPYGLASMWNHPAEGLENVKARIAPITRGKAAEIITASQGVHYESDDAIMYLLGNHFASWKTAPTVEGFGANEKVTRAEALQWIRNLKIYGASPIQQRPTALSDRNSLPTLPPTTFDELVDFTLVPMSVEDLQLQNKEGTFKYSLGTLKSTIDEQLGLPTDKDMFDRYKYGNLGIHYDQKGRMDLWSLTDDGEDVVTSYMTNKRISLHASNLSDVLRNYGTAGYVNNNPYDLANYYYEQASGELVPRFTNREILNHDQAFIITFGFDEKTKKVHSIYVCTYQYAYSGQVK